MNGPEPSDEQLVRRVVRRDVAAFSLLYDRYAPAVYTLAVHMLGRSEADEIVQEVFLRLWNRADQYDPARGPFVNWFMTIARNYLRDALRSRGRDQQIGLTEAIEHSLTELPDAQRSVEDESLRSEQNALISRALQSLPAEQRQALILAYFGGLSQSSIARQLNWPLGTVKKRIRLGLQKLRAFMNGQDRVQESESEPSETGDRYEV